MYVSKVHSVIYNLSGKQWQPVVYMKKSFISLKLVLHTFNVVSCHAMNLIATLWGLPGAINRKFVSMFVTLLFYLCHTVELLTLGGFFIFWSSSKSLGLISKE